MQTPAYGEILRDELGLKPLHAFAQLFDQLLRPTAAVLAAVSTLGLHGKLVMATHVRNGDDVLNQPPGVISWFRRAFMLPGRMHTLMGARVACLSHAAEAAMSLLYGTFNESMLEQHTRFLVLSDNDALLKAARFLSPRVVQIGWSPVHINPVEYTKKKRTLDETAYAQDLVHTVAEWFALRNANVVMSNLHSGFAKTAGDECVRRRVRAAKLLAQCCHRWSIVTLGGRNLRC
jgi:hypothetical protein